MSESRKCALLLFHPPPVRQEQQPSSQAGDFIRFETTEVKFCIHSVKKHFCSRCLAIFPLLFFNLSQFLQRKSVSSAPHSPLFLGWVFFNLNRCTSCSNCQSSAVVGALDARSAVRNSFPWNHALRGPLSPPHKPQRSFLSLPRFGRGGESSNGSERGVRCIDLAL